MASRPITNADAESLYASLTIRRERAIERGDMQTAETIDAALDELADAFGIEVGSAVEVDAAPLPDDSPVQPPERQRAGPRSISGAEPVHGRTGRFKRWLGVIVIGVLSFGYAGGSCARQYARESEQSSRERMVRIMDDMRREARESEGMGYGDR